MRAKTWRAVVGATALLVATSAVSACSSSGSNGKSSASASTTAANTALLGPLNRATGEPLKIGFIYSGQTQAADFRDELTLARATVKYINEHLGGVAGRPLELVACADNQSPATAAECANEMVAAHVPAVLQPSPTQPAAIMKVLAAAKVPYLTRAALDQSVLLSPYGYVMGNPLSVLGTSIKVAKAEGKKKVALFVIDVPASAQLSGIATPLYKKQGLDLLAYAVPLGTPDMTPQVQAAVSKGAESFLVLGEPAFCISALKAMKTVGFTGQVVIISQCLSPNIAKAVPGGLDGVKVATMEARGQKDPDVERYDAVAARYAPGTPPHESTNADSYALVLAFARAMKDLNPSNVTPATVVQTLNGMSPQPMPLLPGQTFQCNRKVSPLTPAVCSNGAAILTLDAAGNVKQSETFDATPYITLG